LQEGGMVEAGSNVYPLPRRYDVLGIAGLNRLVAGPSHVRPQKEVCIPMRPIAWRVELDGSVPLIHALWPPLTSPPVH